MVRFEIDLDTIYPIGSIYMSINDTNPKEYYGGEWEQIEDRFLLACGTNHNNGETGGSATVSLTQSQMPRHNHTQSAHSHGTKYNGYSYVVAETTGANSKRVTTVSTGSTYVDTASTGAFHHYNATDSQTPTINYTGGSGSSASASNGASHENMPPYLAVYMWVRTG